MGFSDLVVMGLVPRVVSTPSGGASRKPLGLAWFPARQLDLRCLEHQSRRFDVCIPHLCASRFKQEKYCTSPSIRMMQHSCGFDVSRPQCWDPISSCRLSETGVLASAGPCPPLPARPPGSPGGAGPGPARLWFGGPGPELFGSLLPSLRCPHRQVAEVPVGERGTTAKGYTNTSLRRTPRRGSGIEFRGEPVLRAALSRGFRLGGGFAVWPRVLPYPGQDCFGSGISS
jgi:hypothetical protein